MTIHSSADAPPAPWCAGGAYLYLLELDGPALAWEYLRRHPSYRGGWQQGRWCRPDGELKRWGLRCRR
ncbi:transcriptional regulator domain-containing protein [Pseudacidovorax sp. RU35E]|uniref:transcriptional regulator domain-containing protein n=1 Tax=Pseudacidovorax sp. RU35E TaxID=1907403 RepID=UPI00095531BE|nr:DUF6499 domain-containing protein [Pseudacidovorax sp. RU35E]SIR52644.1 hypothetical protein SAMN05880557_112164 [Pseudacidovorax sp. RU35E]